MKRFYASQPPAVRLQRRRPRFHRVPYILQVTALGMMSVLGMLIVLATLVGCAVVRPPDCSENIRQHPELKSVPCVRVDEEEDD